MISASAIVWMAVLVAALGAAYLARPVFVIAQQWVIRLHHEAGAPLTEHSLNWQTFLSSQGWRAYWGWPWGRTPFTSHSLLITRLLLSLLVVPLCALSMALPEGTWGWAWVIMWWSWLTVLVLLALIDMDTFLLPNEFTLSLLALGLLFAALGWTGITRQDALAGAAMGYGILWFVSSVYRMVRKREGMGMGDAKLLAAIGAWLGILSVPLVLWLASVIGVFWGLAWRFSNRQESDGAFPFGPSIASAAAVLVLVPGFKSLLLEWLRF